MMLICKTFAVSRWLCLMGGLSTAVVAMAEEGRYALTADQHGWELKTPAGKTMFSYMTSNPPDSNMTANSVCCLYPVYSPSGVRVVDFAPGDHRHHRGVFLAWHTTVCGDQRADFWGWGSMAPTEDRMIRNRQVELQSATEEQAVIRVENDWLIGDRTVLDEQTTITAFEHRGVYVIEFDFRLLPQVDFRIEQTAFGGFCVKARQDGKAAFYGPGGRVDLPTPHHLKPETDWPAQAWYDYVIQLDSGPTVGTAVIDHPDNPPTRWHNLLPIAMVNPCIAAPGPVQRPAGEPLRLRYRMVIHDGPAPVKVLNELAEWQAR